MIYSLSHGTYPTFLLNVLLLRLNGWRLRAIMKMIRTIVINQVVLQNMPIFARRLVRGCYWCQSLRCAVPPGTGSREWAVPVAGLLTSIG